MSDTHRKSEPPDLMLVREAAKKIGCRPVTLRAAINRGRLKGYLLGRDYWVSLKDVKFYLETRWYGTGKKARG